MSKAKQDEVTRRRRLNAGRCPTHGTPLHQIGVMHENGGPVGDRVGCPRQDCDFEQDVKGDSRLMEIWKAAGVI